MQISVEDVKMYLGESIDLNDVMPQLSDKEIIFQMKRQAQAYNDMGPTSIRVTWNDLPDDSNIFFDGQQWILCKSRLNKYLRGDISYSQGGVNVDVTKTQQANLERLAGMYKQDFYEQQNLRKLSCSYRGAWGQVNQTQSPFLVD